jgi:hypothetical protein
MTKPIEIDLSSQGIRAPAAASGVTALAPPSGVKPASGLEQSRSSTGAGDGWIEWGGGECPVEPETKVRVKTIGMGPRTGLAKNVGYWERTPALYHQRAGEIRAYKVVKPEGGQ